ncbi:LuxR C-terminal-related transcriptional regulator [Serratia sp. L9]|uniref:LuxR C-terminal-related transcriptional regulator n=1 Tax=Serratia sp. L9 TaxID=3423946 RepID=UPI003D67DA0A
MKEIEVEPINILLITSCSFTELALKTLLDNLQVVMNKKFNIQVGEFSGTGDDVLEFIICAGDLPHKMSLQSIVRIKDALKYSDISTRMIFITSKPRFALSYFISRLCKKECYCINGLRNIDDIIYALHTVLVRSNAPIKAHCKMQLTSREKEIIVGLIKQVKPMYLSRRFSVDQKTISAHKINALRKLNVERLSEIINLDILA